MGSCVIIVATKDWYFLSHRLPIARAAKAAGFRVVVAANSTGRADEILREGFEFVDLPFDRGSINPVSELRSLLALRRLYKKIKPDLVHHIAIKPSLYGSIAARLARVPAVINTITGLGYLFSSDRILPMILRWLTAPLFRFVGSAPSVRYIFFNTEDREQFCRRRYISPQHSMVIEGSGVDLSRFAPTPEPGGTVTIVCAARLLIDKGIVELVDAVRLLKTQGIECRLILAGKRDSSNRGAVPADMIEQWKQEGIAEIPGFVSDMPRLWSECHIAALPSYYPEGIPLSLIEAAAAGRPSVACNTPGCRDAVIDGKTGLLVPPRDPVSLSKALRTLILDPAIRQQMGAEARRMCERRFDQNIIGQRTIEVYRTLVSS